MDEKEQVKLIAATVQDDIQALNILFGIRANMVEFTESSEFEELEEAQKDVAIMKRMAIDTVAMAFQLYIGTFGGFAKLKTDTNVS